MAAKQDDESTSKRDKKAFEPYRAANEPRDPLQRDRIELFRRSYAPGETQRPAERKQRIKFEVLDDSAEGGRKRGGFDPYNSTSRGGKLGGRD